jgi:carboxyl-terminal processing protease
MAACAPSTGSIGAILAKSHADGTVRVREVPLGLAASRAGVERDDEVLLVDGYDVRALSPERLHELLEGPIGSTVRLTLLRGGQIARVEIVRASLAKTADAPH